MSTARAGGKRASGGASVLLSPRIAAGGAGLQLAWKSARVCLLSRRRGAWLVRFPRPRAARLAPGWCASLPCLTSALASINQRPVCASALVAAVSSDHQRATSSADCIVCVPRSRSVPTAARSAATACWRCSWGLVGLGADMPPWHAVIASPPHRPSPQALPVQGLRCRQCFPPRGPGSALRIALTLSGDKGGGRGGKEGGGGDGEGWWFSTPLSAP